MNEDTACEIVESKCKTEGCWHYVAPNDEYCFCCVSPECRIFLAEERRVYKEAESVLRLVEETP